MQRKKIFLLGFTLLLVSIFLGKVVQVNAAPDASISLGVSVIGEGDEFATQVLGLPWDMNEAPYPDFKTAIKNISRSTFEVDGDFWNFTATSNNPLIWLLWPGIKNTQMVLKLGDRFPIDADKYDLLSFRMCSNVDDYAFIHWFYGRFIPAGLPPNEVSERIPIAQGCHVYVVDMAQQNGWGGSVMGLRLDPVNILSNAQLSIDWVRLTTRDVSTVVPISWSGLSIITDRLNFYLNTSCTTQNSIPIGWVHWPNLQGTFNWGSQLQSAEISGYPWMYYPLPESIEPGNYTVLMVPEGSSSPTCSGTQLEIRKAPTVVIQKPSYFSGPDYATEVVGDPWGMDHSGDYSRLDGFTHVSFKEGLFSGITTNSDPKMFPRVGSPINASKYKYATFRMMVEGIQDVGGGWVQRFFWWWQGPTIDPVTTQDLIVYEGWQTYSLDLSEALIEVGSNWHGYPTALRFDPEEISVSNKMYLDFLTLTGDEIISPGDEFPIYYVLNSENNVDITFYYDTDTNPNNGRTMIGASTQASNSTKSTLSGDYQIFLPLSMKVKPPPLTVNGEINLLTGDRFIWNTAGVPIGKYYISTEVSDGYNTSNWYSEVPVYIQSNQ